MEVLSLKNWFQGLSFGLPEIYLVGGSVRDLLMGGAPKDLDLICRGAAGFARRLSEVHGATLVVMEKKPHQPCFRVVDRLDPSRYLDISEIRGFNVVDDLRLRDFTINAMAMRIEKDCRLGEVIDPCQGRQDIQKGMIRMVDANSLTDDPLRLLRAVRFSACFGFGIEESTAGEMKLRAPRLGEVSAERIMTELLLILETSGSAGFVELMDGLGILEIIFPEIIPMKGCIQNGYHHKDVWTHSLMVLENTERIAHNLHDYFGDAARDVGKLLSGFHRLPLLKLAALLHDMGKPSTRNVDAATGKVRFYGHAGEGAKMVGAAARRLRMSTDSVEFLVLLVSEHLKILDLASNKTRPATVVRWFRKMMDASIPALILSMADVMSILGPDASEEYRQNHMRWATEAIRGYFLETRAQLVTGPFVTGNDLIAMGMKPGTEIGRILGIVRDAQDTFKVSSREEAIELARTLINGISSQSL